MPHNRPLLGIALTVLSSALLAIKDGFAKSFLDEVAPLQMIWVQYVGSFLVLAAMAAPRHGAKVIQPAPIAAQCLRGALSAGAVGTLLWSLTYIPLADATAVFMCAPLVVALLATPVLGEPHDAKRMAAVVTGLVGVLVILRPGFGDGGVGLYIALLSGLCFGGYLLANRHLSRGQAPLLNVTHNALVGGTLLTVLAPLYWQTPAWHTMPKLALIIALAVAGQGLLITAFSFAPAAVLAPFTYAMLVFATLIGVFAFGTVPTATTWCGMALIVGAGLYIAQRERTATASGSLPQ
jgi:drug/metabolite transporter (DMT)-like permease